MKAVDPIDRAASTFATMVSALAIILDEPIEDVLEKVVALARKELRRDD